MGLALLTASLKTLSGDLLCSQQEIDNYFSSFSIKKKAVALRSANIVIFLLLPVFRAGFIQ